MKELYFHHSKGKGARGTITNPPIAVLSNKPEGDHFIKLTPEWYKKPTLPFVPLRELFPLSILDDAPTLRVYIEQFARERGGRTDWLYITVYPNLYDHVSNQ